MVKPEICNECQALKAGGATVYDRIREHANHKQQARLSAAKRSEETMQRLSGHRSATASER